MSRTSLISQNAAIVGQNSFVAAVVMLMPIYLTEISANLTKSAVKSKKNALNAQFTFKASSLNKKSPSKLLGGVFFFYNSLADKSNLRFSRESISFKSFSGLKFTS